MSPINMGHRPFPWDKTVIFKTLNMHILYWPLQLLPLQEAIKKHALLVLEEWTTTQVLVEVSDHTQTHTHRTWVEQAYTTAHPTPPPPPPPLCLSLHPFLYCTFLFTPLSLSLSPILSHSPSLYPTLTFSLLTLCLSLSLSVPFSLSLPLS